MAKTNWTFAPRKIFQSKALEARLTAYQGITLRPELDVLRKGKNTLGSPSLFDQTGGSKQLRELRVKMNRKQRSRPRGRAATR
jgi:hypothetical protein